MAAINDLINQIDNPELRARIQQEVDRINKQKKFGLVFEEHLPECTPLYDIPVSKGSRVALKTGKVNETYVVLKLKGGLATCLPKGGGEPSEFPVADLVSVTEFGEAIYPYLKPIDSVCNAPESDLWHTLIEADNYHALQLLEYLYAGQVDCIYIDPPYNTGARDWKYNNDYVDNVDTYRHSKWLSMMQKRLKIAKKLLNPKNSVMIVTIDEKEYLHLGCLLEEMFPEAKIQMVSSVINPKGTARSNEFSRVNEFIYFVMIGEYIISRTGSDMYRLFVENKNITPWDYYNAPEGHKELIRAFYIYEKEKQDELRFEMEV
jgi:adenine-specific DNA-methyltransferase